MSRVQVEIDGGRVECIDGGCIRGQPIKNLVVNVKHIVQTFPENFVPTVSKAAEMSNPTSKVS